MCPHARLSRAHGHACLVSPAPVFPAGVPRTHQPEVLGAAGRGSAGSILWPLLHSAEGSPRHCWAIWQRVAAGGDGACREGQGGHGKDMFPVPSLLKGMAQTPWGQGHGALWLYLSGAGARAAVALGPEAQPGHPRAGSAAVPGPARRRSDPASAAPLWLKSPRPARPWAPCHQGHPGTPCVSPPLQVLPCLREVHLLHLGQGGRLEQDAWPWAHRYGAGRALGQLQAGAGGQVASTGVWDAGQGAVSCGGTRSAPWGWAHR